MRHTVLIFLVAMAVIAYVQRAAISVPLQEIGADLALTNAAWSLGLLQSAWQLGYAVCQLPAGGVADRLGAVKTLVLAAIGWSLATSATALAPSYWTIVVAWSAMGVFQAAAFPAAVRTIGRSYGDAERARASGWLGAGMLAGGAVAPVLTAWLLGRCEPWAELTGLARWRLVLAAYAVPGLAWAGAYWFFSRRWGAGDAAPPRPANAAAGPTWRQAVADRPLQLLCGQQFLRAAAMVFFITWFPTFLRETRGVSLLESGLLTTCAGAGALAGAVLGGYASDWVLARTGSKRLARQGLAVAGMTACAGLMAASAFVTDVTLAIALITAGAFVATFGGVAGYTVAIDYGGERVGTVFGAMNTAGNLGAMLFPVTIGWLVTATGTWNSALVAFVVLMAIDAVLWAVLNPRGSFPQAITKPTAAAAIVLAVGLVGVPGQSAVATAPPAAPLAPGYNADIRPLLADRCFRCHGPDPAARQADLRLDQRAAAVAARDGGAAIVPGDVAASVVATRIASRDPDLQMPPPDSGSRLSADERDLIRRWIAAGAEYEPHWGFVPPQASTLPSVRDESAIRRPADRFIQARLESLGIEPRPEADPATLCRRLHLDIVGLPPDLAVVEAFAAAYTAAAEGRAREQVYLDLVNRLLDSPRYGERMAAPWLDAARYADTNGYQTDGPRQMWRYRDWVIEAFNRNQPFDEFTIDQLAGDLLPEPTLDQRIATGFNRNHRMNAEGGVIAEEFLVEYVVDRVETTATVWLGLTAGCARCHDHKYDPISQRDFYRLFDFFNRVPEPGKALRDSNSPPLVSAPTPEHTRTLADLQATATAASRAWDELQPGIARDEAAWLAAVAADDLPEESIDLISGCTLRLPLDGPAAGAGGGDVAGPQGGRAASFAGTVPLATDEVPAFDSERPFTAAVWLRPDLQDGTVSVFASWDAALLDQGLRFSLDRGRPRVVISSRLLDDALRVEATQQLPAGRWSHVAWSYDGSRSAAGVRIIVDGKPAATRVLQDELNNRFSCQQPLTIGGGSEAGYRGGICDLRLFERRLEPDELAVVSCGRTPRQLLPAWRSGTADRAASLTLREYFLRSAADPEVRLARAAARDAWRAATAFEQAIPTVMVMEDVPGLRTTHVLGRGEYDKPGEAVTAGVPEALGLPLPPDLPADRLALARWLVDRRHPLTARVTVNRIWQQYFGVGLVKTAGDFGAQGEPPSHQALLDWLAVDFMEHGWDVKRLVREIVTTAAYRRSSRASAEARTVDPDNRLLARGPRFRLPAEAVRDAALAVSGLLVERIGGPSVKPYQPPGLWEELAAGGSGYRQDHGPDLYRRSLYIYRKRTVAVPMFATFDATARETCQVGITRTNTPLQALTLLNDVAFVEAARALGVRMIREGGDTPVARIAHGFRLTTARRPEPRELDLLVAGFGRRRAEFAAAPEAARTFIATGESPLPAAIDPVELAAYASVGNVLLNLDEFLTRE